MMEMPHSVLSEQTLLGMLLINPDMHDLVADRLPASDFYVPLYAEMYELCAELRRQGAEFSPVSLAARMGPVHGEDNIFKQAVALFDAANYATDIATVAFNISDTALQRRLIAYAGRLTEAAHGNKPDEAKRWQEEIGKLARTFNKAVTETPLQQLQAAFQDAIAGQSMMLTGMPCWDNTFGGLFREKIYTISGSGGAGKSALAVNLAWNMAKMGRKVRWVSWEEDRSALWWRIMARETRTPITSFRKQLREHQQAHVLSQQDAMTGADFLAFYKLRDVGQIIDAVGRCDVLVVDGMSRFPAPANLPVVDRVNVVMAACNDICLRTGATILLLSHVNSDSARGGANISGLYGGQAATFDPEGIVDIRRSDDVKHGDGRRHVTLTVLKNRYGPEGLKLPLWFYGEYMDFQEAA